MSQDIGPSRDAGPTVVIGRDEKPICIVDDDAVVCDSLSALLDAHGFKALAHASSAAFLADERRGRLGCLIIDQHMPGTDGLGVLATLRDENITVPSILITGRLDASIAERAAKLAVMAILEKPFPTGRLIELVRAGLDSRA
jgi:FixJ family two-component response regulator